MSIDTNPVPRGLWRQCLAYTRDFAGFAGPRGAAAIALIAGGALLEGIGLVLLVPILGVALNSGETDGWIAVAANAVLNALPQGTRFSRLAFLLGIFAGLMVLRAIIVAARDVMLADLQIGFVSNLRSRIARGLAAARWEAIARLRHSRVTQLLGGNIQHVATAAHFLLQCTVAAFVLLVQCALALALSPLLAALAIGAMLMGALAMTPVLKRVRDVGQNLTDAELVLSDTTAQFLGGLKLALSQNLQHAFVAEFDATQRDAAARQLAYLRQRARSTVAISAFSALLAAAAVLIGVGVLDIQAPVLLALLLVLARMTGPATQIQRGIQQFVHVLPAYQSVRTLESELNTARVTDTVGAESLPAGGKIVFRGVSYRHGNGEAALAGFDLSIETGSVIGIAGPSGAGKSTFADLLVGLIQPQTGEILVGGTPLQGAALPMWRNDIAYVSQDPFLFHDTIRRNLAWANASAGEAEMWKALERAGATALVKAMEHGLDSVVGERGTLVSGGERQRLALARALLRDPRLLVLDEATNAIDVAGEREILERLRQMEPRPTIVMIAHRIESLNFCDRILLFERGRLAADGSFDAIAGRMSATA